jgi:hypothetical protein
MVTFAFPLLVTVTFSDDEDPVFTFPKLKDVVLKESSSVAATPVPLRVIILGEVGALLTIDTLPLAAPEEVGANWRLIVADWPALRESGTDSPLVLNPLPVTLTCEIVNVPVPLFVSFAVCELGEPTVTSPKLALEGMIVNAG